MGYLNPLIHDHGSHPFYPFGFRADTHIRSRIRFTDHGELCGGSSGVE